MSIIQQSTLDLLPRLYSQNGRKDPTVFAKVSSLDDGWAAYLTEGERRGNEFIVFGFFVGEAVGWTQMPLSKMELGLKEAGIKAVEEQSFKPTKLSCLTKIKPGHA